MAVNVRDPQFGVIADGFTDDRAAIQSAINFAKSLTVGGNAAVQYRATVYFPAGYYYIAGPLNLTNTNGIWLTGDGGPYLNTIIIGSTGGAIFDFSGSSLSGCENFTFITSDRNQRSTIGTLFALTNNGGLNCGIRKCYFEMNDTPAANGGFGSVGLLNVRSEEFYIHECVIRANVPLMMSYRAGIAANGASFTATSTFQTLSPGDGSMGVTSINGTSLQCYEKRQPAMVLLGTNSLNFQGYLSRISANVGTNETAILCVNYTTNLKIHATIESFSRALRAQSAGFEGNELDIVVANSTAPTTDILNLTGCTVKGLRLKVSLPNPSERPNRYIVYHDPGSTPNEQVAGFLMNGDISCYDVSANQFIISPNLLKKTVNVVFNTNQPFEKRNGRIRQLSNNTVSLGTNGAALSKTILRFTQADNFASTNGRGGYYRIWIEGAVQAGGYGSGGSTTLAFQAQILLDQRNTGLQTQDTPSISVILLDKSGIDLTYLDVTSVSIGLTFASGIGSVFLTPRVTGAGVGEPIKYDGYAEIQSDFLVNDPIPLALLP